MKIIDVHAHILPQSAVKAHEQDREWFGTRITRLPNGTPGLQTGDRKSSLGALEYWLPHRERLRFMDADGIDLQVLSLNPQLFRDHLAVETAIACAKSVNDEIAETVAELPDRFAGLAALPLQDAGAAVREMERAMGELGLLGFIVGSHVNETNWDDPSLFPILEAAEGLGAFILLHPFNSRIRTPLPRYHMVNLIGNPLETTIAAGSLILGGVLDRLPDLKICLSHAGGYLPFAIGRFDHGYRSRGEVSQHAEKIPSKYLRRFYYDCITHSDEGLAQVVDLVGEDRILLGTDFPADMGLPKPVEWLEARKFLSDRQRAAIVGGNAAALLFDGRHVDPARGPVSAPGRASV
jgi:aminocarboxymuconate-semialdehyde decarboxylase